MQEGACGPNLQNYPGELYWAIQSADRWEHADVRMTAGGAERVMQEQRRSIFRTARSHRRTIRRAEARVLTPRCVAFSNLDAVHCYIHTQSRWLQKCLKNQIIVPLNRITPIGRYIGQTRSVSQPQILNHNVLKIVNARAAWYFSTYVNRLDLDGLTRPSNNF